MGRLLPIKSEDNTVERSERVPNHRKTHECQQGLVNTKSFIIK